MYIQTQMKSPTFYPLSLFESKSRCCRCYQAHRPYRLVPILTFISHFSGYHTNDATHLTHAEKFADAQRKRRQQQE